MMNKIEREWTLNELLQPILCVGNMFLFFLEVRFLTNFSRNCRSVFQIDSHFTFSPVCIFLNLGILFTKKKNYMGKSVEKISCTRKFFVTFQAVFYNWKQPEISFFLKKKWLNTSWYITFNTAVEKGDADLCLQYQQCSFPWASMLSTRYFSSSLPGGLPSWGWARATQLYLVSTWLM